MASEPAAGGAGTDRTIETLAAADVRTGSNGTPASAGDTTIARMPPPWGGPLNNSDYVTLAASWITPEIADAAMLRRVDAHEGREVVGQKGSRDCTGIVIPYYWPGEPHAFNYRLRRDNPEWTVGKDGKVKPDRKYLSPPGGANRLFIPPGITLQQLADPSIPIAVVEGEKKSLALSRLAKHEAGTLRFIPVGIGGVWNWRGTIGKTGGPKGERLDVKGPINDLSRVVWADRVVFIVFDSNVHTNDNVRWARTKLGRELATRGAQGQLVNLPKDCGVNGVDDLLAAWGPPRVLELFEKATSGTRLHVVLPPQFQSKPEGMYRVTTKGEQLSQVQLTNYQAAITTNIRIDDGVETKREFEIAAELMGRKYEFTIPATEFAAMEWPIERMGSPAITYPTQRDYARTAIQSLSITAAERVIYAHTGWRHVDGHWLFLHAGGAIGAAGPVADVNVRLPGATSRYELRLPSGQAELVAAIQASLNVAQLGPASISFPLLAATYRAVLGGADFAVHLAGETGAFKSEVAALHQQHYGAGMDRLHLPGAWASTGNSLEAMAFHAKDTLFTIDDFAPQGSSADVARYHAVADRVLRAAGNHAGRGRLDSTARLREPKPPRALILSTGEDVPRGQSVRARILILELANGDIEAGDLTERQAEGQRGLYAEAMGRFVLWLAGRYEDARASFDRRTTELRVSAAGSAEHARTPEIVASLQAGFELFLDFSLESGAVSQREREWLADRCWKALCGAAAAQTRHQAANEPAARFLALIRSALTCGRAHLEERRGGKPDQLPGACGWRQDNSGNWEPLGDCIGWVADDNVYLDPTAAYRIAQLIGRDLGEILAITELTLNKRLKEKGFLASVDASRGTLTIRRAIGGTSKQVLHLLRETLLPEAWNSSNDESEDVS